MFQSVNKKSPILLSVRARLNKKFWADVAKWIPCRPGCPAWQDSTRPWWVIMVTALWHSTTSDHNWSQYQNLSAQINDKVFNSLSLISPCRNLLPRSLSLPATTNAQFLGLDGRPVSTNETMALFSIDQRYGHLAGFAGVLLWCTYRPFPLSYTVMKTDFSFVTISIVAGSSFQSVFSNLLVIIWITYLIEFFK